MAKSKMYIIWVYLIIFLIQTDIHKDFWSADAHHIHLHCNRDLCMRFLSHLGQRITITGE